MAHFSCRFCGVTVVIDHNTVVNHIISFYNSKAQIMNNEDPKNAPVKITMYYCPNCHNISVEAWGAAYFDSFHRLLFPTSNAKKFPEYVPRSIQNDYTEACAIAALSPKASATLARRCLQTMIHDFWGISEKNLNAEITQLKGKIQTDLWIAIDAIRKIGNIGAHMEQDINLIIDVEPFEAEKLLLLIELLIAEWYIARHNRQTLLADIAAIGASKTEQQKSSPN